jgi:chaperonin GroEL
MCGLLSAITETAIVDEPADEDEHAGDHHGHAH